MSIRTNSIHAIWRAMAIVVLVSLPEFAYAASFTYDVVPLASRRGWELLGGSFTIDSEAVLQGDPLLDGDFLHWSVIFKSPTETTYELTPGNSFLHLPEYVSATTTQLTAHPWLQIETEQSNQYVRFTSPGPFSSLGPNQRGIFLGDSNNGPNGSTGIQVFQDTGPAFAIRAVPEPSSISVLSVAIILLPRRRNNLNPTT